MALAFISGNLLGRAVISYMIVFIVCWVLGKLRFKDALSYSLRWYSLIAVLVLTLFGAGVAMSRIGGD